MSIVIDKIGTIIYSSRFVLSAQKREQRLLHQALASLFPSHEIHFDAKRIVDLRSSESGRLLEIDAWIPDLKIGFEYQVPYLPSF